MEYSFGKVKYIMAKQDNSYRIPLSPLEDGEPTMATVKCGLDQARKVIELMTRTRSRFQTEDQLLDFITSGEIPLHMQPGQPAPVPKATPPAPTTSFISSLVPQAA
jgi:hypothetical protein